MQNKKGFTLIELLVVIAIIGILTSVVLASLNSARTKGADTGVKANLATVRTQSAMYYDANADYGTTALAATAPTTCPAYSAGSRTSLFAGDKNINDAIAQAKSNGGGTVNCVAVGSPITAWGVSALMKTTPAQYWCVDSAGSAGTTTAGTIDATKGTCNP